MRNKDISGVLISRREVPKTTKILLNKLFDPKIRLRDSTDLVEGLLTMVTGFQKAYEA